MKKSNKNVTKYDKLVKITVKDSVFSDFFGMPENLFELYKTLHPEDNESVIDDLKDVTIKNVLVNDLYNDLGFRVRDRLLILIEAQSTWSINIVVRVLIYLANSYHRYVDENGLDIYHGEKIKLPKPELFVLFTGTRSDKPDEISLADEFFEGDSKQLELKVKMLYGYDKDDVISQYVAFTKVYDEQRTLHGRTRETILNTIKICKDKNIMKQYFEKRETEVISMYMTLYDDETILRNHDAQLTRDVTKQVTKDATTSEREGILKELIEDGTITAEKADAIREKRKAVTMI